jgi:hypothetical protein
MDALEMAPVGVEIEVQKVQNVHDCEWDFKTSAGTLSGG